MHLDFPKLLIKLVVSGKYLSYTKGTLKKKRSARGLATDVNAMFLCFFCCFFSLIFSIKAYVVGTHLNCIDSLMQFKLVPTTYAFIKK